MPTEVTVQYRGFITDPITSSVSFRRFRRLQNLGSPPRTCLFQCGRSRPSRETGHLNLLFRRPCPLSTWCHTDTTTVNGDLSYPERHTLCLLLNRGTDGSLPDPCVGLTVRTPTRLPLEPRSIDPEFRKMIRSDKLEPFQRNTEIRIVTPD